MEKKDNKDMHCLLYLYSRGSNLILTSAEMSQLPNIYGANGYWGLNYNYMWGSYYIYPFHCVN